MKEVCVITGGGSTRGNAEFKHDPLAPLKMMGIIKDLPQLQTHRKTLKLPGPAGAFLYYFGNAPCFLLSLYYNFLWFYIK